MKRPALKIGDVVRLSKRGKQNHGMYCGHVMVVESFSGDSSDGRTQVECSTFLNGSFVEKTTFKRRELWSTGYNSLSKNRAVIKNEATPAFSQNVSRTNDGRTHCMECRKPTRFVPGFGSGGYNLCQNKSCPMFDR